jgi:hypothetical protein
MSLRLPSFLARTRLPAGRRARVPTLFLILLVSLAIRFPVLHVPFDRDEGGFSYIAWRWSQGEVPYRDAFDNKPPLLYASYRVAQAVFGTQPEGIHLFLILLGILQVALFYKIARRWFSEAGALAATVAFSLLAAEPTYGVGSAATAEAFVLLPVLLTVYFLPGSAFLAGLCIGAAIMTKQTAVLYALAFGASLLVARSDLSFRSRFAALGKYASGAFIVPALCASYFWMRGTWVDFLYAVFTYNLQHTTEVATGGRLADGFKGLLDNLHALAPAEAGIWLAALAGLAVLVRSKRSERWTLLLWSLAAVASLCVSFRFLSHYFLELAPVVALALGALVSRLWPKQRRGIVISGMLLAAMYGVANRAYLWGGSPEAFSRATYQGNYFVEADRVARYIAETTQPSDKVFIFGSEPEILFLAKRQSPTRHIFFYPLTIERVGALAFQQEVARDIERGFPAMIVWINNPLSFLAGPNTDRFILDKGSEWLHSGRYRFDGAVFAKAGEPSKYLLGPEAAPKVDPATIKEAAYVLYRLRPAVGPSPLAGEGVDGGEQ